MAKKNAVRVTPSTGNIFRDLGFSKEESEHLLVRADLLIHVQKAIASRGLKQAEAAKALRVTQPRVSDLLRGRVDLFSTDSLIDMLSRLGCRVTFSRFECSTDFSTSNGHPHHGRGARDKRLAVVAPQTGVARAPQSYC